MNFPVVPTIQEAMIQRAKLPTFGYFMPREEYTQSIIDWQKSHNNADVNPENLGHENGVLGAVVTALSILCSKGDNVLIHAPTYTGFTSILTNNGYHIVHSQLVIDEQGIWRMDYEDMEKKIVENKIHTAIFCSPPQPHWPRMGEVGNCEGHGTLQEARCVRHLRRDMVRYHPHW